MKYVLLIDLDKPGACECPNELPIIIAGIMGAAGNHILNDFSDTFIYDDGYITATGGFLRPPVKEEE